MIYTNKKRVSMKNVAIFFSATLILASLLVMNNATSVSAAVCYGDGGTSGSTVTCPDVYKNEANACYRYIDNDELGERWEKIDCPTTNSTEDSITDFNKVGTISVADDYNAEAAVKDNPIFQLLLTFINFLTAGVGLVVTTLVVVGGLQYMTAGGNPQKTQAAIMRISNALIGLVLYIFMFAILQWLIPGGLFG